MIFRIFLGLFALAGALTANAYELRGEGGPEGAEVYIVTFRDPGVVDYAGGIKGLRATAGIMRKRIRNAESVPEVRAYLDHLDRRHAEQKDRIKAGIGRDFEPLHTYRAHSSGMSLLLTEAEAQLVGQMDEVTRIVKDRMYELDTDAGPQWIGADAIWNGTAAGGAPANKGEGVLIGILDTGVNMDHPSFSDSPEDGYTFVNPFGDGVFRGDCSATYVCNNKLVGAWDFADGGFGSSRENDGPEDSAGHGSHTAATAAGNFITGPFTDSATGNAFAAPSISGVAPHANLITYDVCRSSCAGSDIEAGIDQALLDGVDVINFSISGGESPWTDNDRLFLNLVNAGTLVAASAGNTTATITDPVGEVNHLGPWMLTVANQSHDRVNSNSVSVTGGPQSLQNMYGLLGAADNFDGSDVNDDILYAGDIDAGNFEGCTAWPNGNEFDGAVALISRGDCTFVDKIDNAAAAGAVAALIFNNDGLLPTGMGGIETTTIPALMIGQADGENLRDYIDLNPGTMVVISGTSVRANIASTGSIINASSLRGPNDSFDVTKPDIGGPGTSIFAAYADSGGAAPQYAFLTGTSMSSPHLAGAAALLKSLHPDWSPSEIKSALMMTARPGFTETGSPAHPDIHGSGTVDLSKAAGSGLVMDETYADYLAANPSSGGNPETLNIPSMRSSDCDGTCSWQREVCTSLETPSSWTVSTPAAGDITVNVTPSTFSFIPSASIVFMNGFEGGTFTTQDCQTLTIEVVVNSPSIVAAGEMVFSGISLGESGAKAPDAVMTISILPTGVD